MQGLGTALSSIGGAMPSFLGGPTGTIGSALSGWGGAMAPPTFDPSVGSPTGMPNIPGDPAAWGAAGMTPYVPSTPAPGVFPTDPTLASGAYVPSTTPFTGSPLAAPFDPYGTATTPGAGGTPTYPSGNIVGNVLSSLLPGTTGAGGGTAGAPGGPSQWGPFISGLGNLGEGVLRFHQMQQLMDPTKLLKYTQALHQGESAAFKRAVAAPAIAAGQETNQINAPYLMNQAIATAAAPDIYNAYNAQMQAALEALGLGMGAYPYGGMGQATAGLVQPGLYGGGTGGGVG